MSHLFAWQKSVLHALNTHDVVVLHGNIRDLYIFYALPHYYEVRFDELLARLLCPQFGEIRRFDPYSKASNLSFGPANTYIEKDVDGFGSPGFNVTTNPTLAQMLSQLESQGQRRLWLLKQMHNLLPFRSSYSEEESLRLIAFQRMIENMRPGNKLVLCYLSDTQVPVELSENAHRVTFVKVPMPDFDERRCFWKQLLEASAVNASATVVEATSDLAKLTDGLALTSLQRLAQTALREAQQRQVDMCRLTSSDWERILAHFKFGDTRDFYRQITPEQLEGAYEFFTMKEGIQGQDYAVKQMISMLWKARTNVSALLRSGSSNAPRGALFLCGPSGTGKTMLCKKTAKLVFGSEDAVHRIDMSEYQQDFSVSKLIGSPPGYVGYEMGGVLTNAIREKPFSVVLFDEIEKGHPRVFDLFLQILSDGRLTDNRGQTAFFSEAIIIFTSNIGTRASEVPHLQEAQQSEDPERVRQHFVRCVRDFFRYEISRPELLNRIGNNIVPFNYLESSEVLTATVKYYLISLRARFNQEYGSQRKQMEIDVDQVAAYIAAEHSSSIREFGGRAVLNVLDDILMPLLAKQLLLYEHQEARGVFPRAITLKVGIGIDRGKQRLTISSV